MYLHKSKNRIENKNTNLFHTCNGRSMVLALCNQQ